MGRRSGAFELNVYIPMMARNLLESFKILTNVSKLFAERCIDGLVANEERLRELAGVVTVDRDPAELGDRLRGGRRAWPRRRSRRRRPSARRSSTVGLIGDKLSEAELDKRLDVLAMGWPR